MKTASFLVMALAAFATAVPLAQDAPSDAGVQLTAEHLTAVDTTPYQEHPDEDDWDFEDDESLDVDVDIGSRSDTSPSGPLIKRGHDWDGLPKCYTELRNINHIAHFNTASGRLRSWNKRFTIPAKTCKRIACQKSAGIFACNHNKYSISRHTQTIYDFYGRIVNHHHNCIMWGSNVAGRQKSKASWSVLAVKTNCNGPSSISDSSWPN